MGFRPPGGSPQCPTGTHPEHFQPKTCNPRFTRQIKKFQTLVQTQTNSEVKDRMVADRLEQFFRSKRLLQLKCFQTPWLADENKDIKTQFVPLLAVSHISQTYHTYLKLVGWKPHADRSRIKTQFNMLVLRYTKLSMNYQILADIS